MTSVRHEVDLKHEPIDFAMETVDQWDNEIRRWDAPVLELSGDDNALHKHRATTTKKTTTRSFLFANHLKAPMHPKTPIPHKYPVATSPPTSASSPLTPPHRAPPRATTTNDDIPPPTMTHWPPPLRGMSPPSPTAPHRWPPRNQQSSEDEGVSSFRLAIRSVVTDEYWQPEQWRRLRGGDVRYRAHVRDMVAFAFQLWSASIDTRRCYAHYVALCHSFAELYAYDRSKDLLGVVLRSWRRYTDLLLLDTICIKEDDELLKALPSIFSPPPDTSWHDMVMPTTSPPRGTAAGMMRDIVVHDGPATADDRLHMSPSAGHGSSRVYTDNNNALHEHIRELQARLADCDPHALHVALAKLADRDTSLHVASTALDKRCGELAVARSSIASLEIDHARAYRIWQEIIERTRARSLYARCFSAWRSALYVQSLRIHVHDAKINFAGSATVIVQAVPGDTDTKDTNCTDSWSSPPPSVQTPFVTGSNGTFSWDCHFTMDFTRENLLLAVRTLAPPDVPTILRVEEVSVEVNVASLPLGPVNRVVLPCVDKNDQPAGTICVSLMKEVLNKRMRQALDTCETEIFTLRQSMHSAEELRRDSMSSAEHFAVLDKYRTELDEAAKNTSKLEQLAEREKQLKRKSIAGSRSQQQEVESLKERLKDTEAETKRLVSKHASDEQVVYRRLEEERRKMSLRTRKSVEELGKQRDKSDVLEKRCAILKDKLGRAENAESANSIAHQERDNLAAKLVAMEVQTSQHDKLLLAKDKEVAHVMARYAELEAEAQTRWRVDSDNARKLNAAICAFRGTGEFATERTLDSWESLDKLHQYTLDVLTEMGDELSPLQGRAVDHNEMRMKWEEEKHHATALRQELDTMRQRTREEYDEWTLRRANDQAGERAYGDERRQLERNVAHLKDNEETLHERLRVSEGEREKAVHLQLRVDHLEDLVREFEEMNRQYGSTQVEMEEQLSKERMDVDRMRRMCKEEVEVAARQAALEVEEKHKEKHAALAAELNAARRAVHTEAREEALAKEQVIANLQGELAGALSLCSEAKTQMARRVEKLNNEKNSLAESRVRWAMMVISESNKNALRTYFAAWHTMCDFELVQPLLLRTFKIWKTFWSLQRMTKKRDIFREQQGGSKIMTKQKQSLRSGKSNLTGRGDDVRIKNTLSTGSVKNLARN